MLNHNGRPYEVRYIYANGQYHFVGLKFLDK